MENIDKIRQIFDCYGGIARTSDLKRERVYYNNIQTLIEQGIIEKIRYGYYQWVSDNPNADEVQMVRQLFPDGILCMNTALFHYHYIDRVPNEWHIAVSKDSTKSRFKNDYPFFKPYYVKPEFLEIGLVTDKMNDKEVRIYNKERLICDVLRRFYRMDIELIGKAIQAYIIDPKRSITRLMEYARIFKIEKKVREIIGVWF